MAVNIRKLTTSTPMLYNYKYDQLNRISSMDAWAANGSFGPTGSGPLQDYAERYTYDPNGNILNLVRHGYGSSIPMDSMSYRYGYIKTDGSTGEYVPGQTLPGSLDHLTNRLSSIGDIASTGYDDIKNQSALNYRYDAIGNLVYDGQSGITGVNWSVYGKILTITNASGTIYYTYDASGNRISKKVGNITTWYVRDATGNVMATYVTGDNTKNSGALTQTEVHVYGSSRLGILNLNVNCNDLLLPVNSTVERGGKFFELTNHLGNVLVTITDKKLQKSAGLSTVDSFTVDVASASDYYPFGMQMPGRVVNSAGYRYGFNGKENDNEVKGQGNFQDYGMRGYDPQTGRFWSVDPLTGKYPWYSPYQFAGNKPTWATDLDGLEENTTSTYVYHPPVPAIFKPAFQGTITITDAVSESAHRTSFQGSYTELLKTNRSQAAIVNALTGGNSGTSASRLDITMTGTRSAVSKSWRGTDMKYFTQFSYSFTSNNIVEKGTFELQSGQIAVSARAWDPLVAALLGRVSSISRMGVTTPYEVAAQSTSTEALQASQQVYNGTTLYRIGTLGISKTGEAAQFWSLENPLEMGLEEYAKKYGVPLKNLKNANFLETATLKQGAKYITREAPIAPGAPAGSGGGIEAVVQQGGTTGNVITPIQH